MALRVALQADHPKGWKPATDTSLLLALEGQARGHDLYFYEPKNISMENTGVTARMSRARFSSGDSWFTLEDEKSESLDGFDVVLMRNDPPFDMAYLSATYFLEHAQKTAKKKLHVLNDPAEVRNAPEKIFPFLFAEFMPPTLVTTDMQAIRNFKAKHEDIILKPLYGYAGGSVLHLKPGDNNLNAFFDFYFLHSNEPLIAQKFLPEVKSEDIRVIIIEGEVAASVGRIPAEGEHRANFRTGGKPAEAALNEKQKRICHAVGAELKRRGILLGGIDLIGDYLTEINLTSPTTFPAANALYGIKLESLMWDAIEKRVS